MGKKWDYKVPSVDQWEQALRVLKPGGHLLSACGTRTQHRMVVNIEDAGFEIRDVITWHYGSGFPKSLDISKAIDKQAGAEREVVREKYLNGGLHHKAMFNDDGWKGSPQSITTPATDDAKKYAGYGTALKPATEFWTLCRKSLSEKTIAENVLKWGTGGINIDGCRIETGDSLQGGGSVTNISEGWNRPFRSDESKKGYYKEIDKQKLEKAELLGRFPANVIFDEFTGSFLDRQSGFLTSGAGNVTRRADNKVFASGNQTEFETYGDSGGASRFFYCAKADRFERNKGLKDFDIKPLNWSSGTQNPGSFQSEGTNRSSQNNHPTVKPIDLMRYLVKLITPKGGLCLDPFCGSGTTLIAAKLELLNYIGIDLKEDYCKIAEARVKAWNPEKYIKQELF